MFYLYFILLFILILLFLPFPIKLRFNYSQKSYYFYIYNFNVFKFLEKRKKKEYGESLKEDIKKLNFKFNFNTIISLLNYVDTIKYKPTIRFKLYCNYGFIDASETAIAYGYIYSISPFLYKLLNMPFKIKSYDYNIEPYFKGIYLESNINSIIFVNLIKIIYMFILIRNKMKFLKD